MAGNTIYSFEVKNAILAGVVFGLEASRAHDRSNVEFVNGILTMAKYTALAFGVPWPEIVNDAKAALGGDLGDLLDAGQRGVIEGGR